ncbi:MAG: hypothetical protein CM15mP116_07260 [Synechococcus sp.]|nr:MAG: hypothetical protein CM15mP116_07260 [Synechococcus sp.]
MATAISKGASTDVIRQLALESGMVTLLGYSLELVRRGETTLEEVGRMVLTDSRDWNPSAEPAPSAQ